MRKSFMFIAVLMMLASSASADLPPFVSDTFDLYQLGGYHNPVTYRHLATDLSGPRREIFSTGHTAYDIVFSFDVDTSEWFSGDIVSPSLRWFLEDGTYILLTNVGPIVDVSVSWPYEYPLVIEGSDPDLYTRSYQIEWLEPSGELCLVHFVMGIWHGVFIDTVLCVTAAIIRAFTVDIFRF